MTEDEFDWPTKGLELALKAQTQARVEYAETKAKVQADLDRLERNEFERALQLLDKFVKAELSAGEGTKE